MGKHRGCLVIALLGTAFCLLADPVAPPQREITSLPENIRLIVGKGEKPYSLPRIRAIHALPDNLPPDQVRACGDFLFTKIETQELPDLEFNGVKNELAFALMRQRQKPVELAGYFVRMYYDKSYDETWRDYCVQFFGKWYPDAPENEGRRAMVDGLWHALKNERGSRIAGAAGSQLCFLAREYPDRFDASKVSEAGFEALTDPGCAGISKVALLQTCAMLNHPRVLPIARQLAATERDPVLRASAVGVIGLLGDRSDLPLLEKLKTSRDLRLQRPAEFATVKIENRGK